MAEIPNIPISSMDKMVREGIGDTIDLKIHELSTTVTSGRTKVTSEGIAREVAKRVMEIAGIPDDKSVERLCCIAAEVAMGRLATSPGFTVAYGPESQPREIVRVDLRPDEPRMTNINALINPSTDG